MKDFNGREMPIRTVLKWLRGQRRVSYQWLRRQYKGVESGQYSKEEWTKFLVESKTISRTLPHVSAITPEWTLLEREWLVEALIKKLTGYKEDEVTPLEEIEYGVELYYMVENFAKDLFCSKTIKKLQKVVTRCICRVQRVEDQCKLMGLCNESFKESVEALKAYKEDVKCGRIKPTTYNKKKNVKK